MMVPKPQVQKIVREKLPFPSSELLSRVPETTLLLLLLLLLEKVCLAEKGPFPI